MGAPIREIGRRELLGLGIGAVFCAVAVLTLSAPAALAVVQPPTTIDGPSSAILELGGVAMAPDGTGGLVYTKEVEGVPHVFASRYDGNRWSAPIRVDWDQPYDASQPRIAAGPKGRLMVVWVTQVATVQSQIQRGLFSAILDPGASAFGPSLLVDPNVGKGAGVDPSVAGVSAGKAIVAYKVVTNEFADGSGTTAVQLRPGDVMADVRVARFAGERWSRLGAVNRNPATSMRPPSSANAPQVGIGASGNAVVAWQEPDQTAAARIWARRVFGTTLGPPIQASPSTWEGNPVPGDAGSFALAVTAFDQARIVSRVNGGGTGPVSGPRLFLGTLEPNYAEAGAKLAGPSLADGGGGSPPAGLLGVPAVAASGEGGGEGKMMLTFAAGADIHRLAVDGQGHLLELAQLTAPVPERGAGSVAAVDPQGGGVTAYEAVDGLGRPAVAVRQEFPSGAAQTGVLSGLLGGPVSELRGSGSESGDALIGFRQGEPGREIVAARVSSPPASFHLRVPKGWVRPPAALLRWQAPPGMAGGMRYAVVIDGRVAKRDLLRRRFRPRPALLGTGVRRVRILATDAFGGQVLTKPAKLMVDADPPTARVKTRALLATVILRDRGSGVRAAACRFGDSAAAMHGRRTCRHRYSRPGRFTVVVHERDRAGNRITRKLEVRIR